MMADVQGRTMTEDLKSWLSGIGLGSHAENFASNGIDWDVLLELNETDLKELGLSLGDRKRLLKAISGLKRDAPTAEVSMPLAPSVASQPRTSNVVQLASARTDHGPAAERRSITVMFVDLVGSTPLSEKLDPEDLREVLRAFHEGCAAAIEAEDGHTARYLGDGVLVYFGYPHAHEDDAARAVRAGLGIIDKLKPANEKLRVQFGVSLQARIGIHTGLVVVGDVGAGAARDREAIVGETPNIAARLQGEAEPDTVVISAATRRLVEGLFSFEDVGSRALKGVSALIRIFRVVAPAEAPDCFTARAGRGLTPLIGRAAELDMLRQRWAQARDGEMRCVRLVGEAGIGKSRVVHAFREWLADQPHQIVTWYCSSYHRTSAFFPVITWFCRSLGIDLQGDHAEGVAKLVEGARSIGIEDRNVPATTALMLGLTAEESAMPEESALAYRRRLLDALSTTIRAMAHRQTLLMVVEDAHWADPSTLDLLRELQEQLPTSRLLLLVTSRPEFKPDWSYPHFVQVNLDRLSRRERHSMVEQLTGGKALPDFVLDQIVARTDGVPLFVEELTKTVLEENAWRDAGNRYELEGPFQGITIPDSLQGSLLARLDRLDPAAKEIAQIGATIGREFNRELLSIVAQQEDEILDTGLEQLVAAEIVQPMWLPAIGGRAFAFRHALIQDAAYQSLLLARRRQYHAAIGQSLLANFPEIAAAQPELVAQHLTTADQVEPAIDAWLRTANSDMDRGAYAEAKAHVTRGLELIRRLPDEPGLRSRRAVPFLLIRGRLEIKEMRSKAQGTFYRAATLARAAGMTREFAHAAIGMGMVEQFGFSPNPMAKDLLKEALDSQRIDDPILRCRLLSWLGRALFLMDGDVEGCVARLDEARALLDQHHDKQCERDILSTEMMIQQTPVAAEFEHRTRVYRHYVEVTRLLADPFEAMYGAGLTAARFLEIGDIEGFHANLRHIAELARTTQAAGDRWLRHSFEAMSALLAGDYAAAERAANDAYGAVKDAALGQYLGPYGVQMFAIRRDQGRLAEVAPLVKRFVSENPDEAIWKPGLMLIASDLGFRAQARQHFESFAATDFALPQDAKRQITLSYFAEVCAALGDAQRAERLHELLYPYRDVTMMMPPHTLCTGATRHYLGMLAATMDDWRTAEEHFREALAFNERLKAWPRLAWTRFEYARMLLARGLKDDSVLAMELRKMAVGAAERMGMGLLLQRNAKLEVRA
ncbi:MAG TPA: adenylate/guanylate cyclase domain-containing protein [Reyranella sp.]|nr:adenylate/guanylate cyclase domain-containing protein [Reyranella sp.]